MIKVFRRGRVKIRLNSTNVQKIITDKGNVGGKKLSVKNDSKIFVHKSNQMGQIKVN